MAAALEGEDGKADSNPLFALEKQFRRKLGSELRRVPGSFYTPNAMKTMAKQAVTQKGDKARSVRVFKALLYLGDQVMSEVANTSAAEHLALMNKAPEHRKPNAECGLTTAKANGFAYNSADDFHDPVQFLHLVKKRHAQPGGRPGKPPGAVKGT